MAARKQLYHPDEVRQKIQTSQFINRLTDHIFGRVELTKSQVSAALGLLRKTLPDLQVVEMEVEGRIGHYESQPIPTEERHTDTMAGSNRAAINGHST